jgi:hypothetical protein
VLYGGVFHACQRAGQWARLNRLPAALQVWNKALAADVVKTTAARTAQSAKAAVAAPGRGRDARAAPAAEAAAPATPDSPDRCKDASSAPDQEAVA